MLKEKTIEKLKKSKYKAKLKAQKSHYKKLQKRREQKQLIKRHYRNLNAIVLTRESDKHLYAKFIVSLVIHRSGNDIITEFPLKHSEADIYSPTLSIIVEVEKNATQKSKIDKKLAKYDYLIQSGFLNDIFIFDLDKDFTGVLSIDIKHIKEKLGL